MVLFPEFLGGVPEFTGGTAYEKQEKTDITGDIHQDSFRHGYNFCRILCNDCDYDWKYQSQFTEK